MSLSLKQPVKGTLNII